jgi:Hpt domain
LVRSRGGNSAVLTSLFAIGSTAHGLAGAGGIFGFNEIGDAAAALVEAVTLERDGSGTVEEVGSALDRVQRAAYRIMSDRTFRLE